MENSDIMNRIKTALLEGNAVTTEESVREALSHGAPPIAIMDVLVEALRKVGDEFGEGILFLPELVASAGAMEKANLLLEEAIKNGAETRNALGKVLIGTVFGDIHTIGKALVGALLTAEGFKVHDLGIDVPTEKFIQAVKELKPDVLAMSALLTTTAPEARKVIEELNQQGLREDIKVIVGGGAITESYAKSIGADGYDATAPGAVKMVRELLNL